MERGTDWEVVFRTHSDVEMELIKGLLTTNGFPVVVEASGAKSMATFFGHSANGELVIKVPPDLAEQAIAMLNAQVEEPEQE